MGTGQVGWRAILFSSCHVSCNYQNCIKNNVFNGKNTYLLRRCVVARQSLNYVLDALRLQNPTISLTNYIQVSCFSSIESLVWLPYRIEEKQMIEIYVHVIIIIIIIAKQKIEIY